MSRPPTSSPLDRLHPTELQVLELMAASLRNVAIAHRLGKSEKTVERHVRNIFAKLGLRRYADPDIDRRVAAVLIFLAHSDQPSAGPLSGTALRG